MRSWFDRLTANGLVQSFLRVGCPACAPRARRVGAPARRRGLRAAQSLLRSKSSPAIHGRAFAAYAAHPPDFREDSASPSVGEGVFRQYFSAALSCFAEKPRAYLLRFALPAALEGPGRAFPGEPVRGCAAHPCMPVLRFAAHPWTAKNARFHAPLSVLSRERPVLALPGKPVQRGEFLRSSIPWFTQKSGQAILAWRSRLSSRRSPTGPSPVSASPNARPA